jgi:AraC-like DNA-binding protein
LAEFERSLDLNTTSSASWLQLVTILGHEADRPDGLFRHRLAMQTLQNLLIQGLLLMQPHNYTDALSKDENSAPREAVMRAIELMRANPETSWTTGKLAQTVGVSARALQKGFARSDELPPMTYLRRLRLHRAHSELLDAAVRHNNRGSQPLGLLTLRSLRPAVPPDIRRVPLSNAKGPRRPRSH